MSPRTILPQAALAIALLLVKIRSSPARGFVAAAPGTMLRTLASAVVACALLGACDDAALRSGSARSSPASLQPTPCRVDGVDSEVQCATLEVWENRSTLAGRKIPINIVILPATARVHAPDPLFVFAGGPGQAATDLAPAARIMFGELNAKRDIVLIDQRGTGRSNPLNCRLPERSDAGMADARQRDRVTAQQLALCRDTLAARADLTQYTTGIAVADFDAVREALGYAEINLWGASYGTRSAMEYLRRHPQRVRSVTLDGVAPPSMPLPAGFSRDAGVVYDKLFAACEQDRACTGHFPALKRDFEKLLDSLTLQARRVSIADGLTGRPKTLEVTRDMVLMSLFSALYAPERTTVLPAILGAAIAGDFAPLFAHSAIFSDFAEDKIAFGMRLSVLCAEDVPRLAPVEAAGAAQRAPFGRAFVDEFTKACAAWPRGATAPDFVTPVRSDKPILILSGGLDPVTPPQYGDEVRKALSNAAHFVAPNLGHGVTGRGCAQKLLKKFVDNASATALDGDCLKRLPRPLFIEPMMAREKPTAGDGT